LADFTCLWTAEGWLYIAAVVDLFSRRVVDYSMSARRTAQFVTDTLVMTLWRRGMPDPVLHYSDRGSQYTSEPFQRLLPTTASPVAEAESATSGTMRRWRDSSPR
jgi:putative transposase